MQIWVDSSFDWQLNVCNLIEWSWPSNWGNFKAVYWLHWEENIKYLFPKLNGVEYIMQFAILYSQM